MADLDSIPGRQGVGLAAGRDFPWHVDSVIHSQFSKPVEDVNAKADGGDTG